MTATTTAAKWTKPFHGVQHLGSGKPSDYWITVEDRNTFAKLLRWFPGCGFSPQESIHDSVAKAKAAGEKWMVGTK